MPKVLIVDDETEIRDVISDLLQSRGYEVIQAEGGRKALEKAFTETPDVVILDVMMPEMDGFQFLRKLRENAITKTTPVIMLTAVPVEEGEMEGMEYGVHHYITKPWTADQLELTVKVALREAGM